MTAALLLAGCGNKISKNTAASDEKSETIIETNVEKSSKITSETSSDELPDNSIQDFKAKEKLEGKIVSDTYGTGYGSWQKAYLSYIEKEGYDDFDYALIYLDNNDVPELYINTNVEAGGEQVLTYYDDKLNQLLFGRIGSEYIEREGLIYNNRGHMDYYPVNIFAMKQVNLPVFDEYFAKRFEYLKICVHLQV